MTLSALILIDLTLTGRRWFREEPAIYVIVPVAVVVLSFWRYKLYYKAFRDKRRRESKD